MGEIIKFRKPIYDSKGTDWAEVFDLDNILELAFSDILKAGKFLLIRYIYENLDEENKALPDEIEDVYKSNIIEFDEYSKVYILAIIIGLITTNYCEIHIDLSINDENKYIDKIINNNDNNYSIEIISNLIYKIEDTIEEKCQNVIIKFYDGVIISLILVENTKLIIMDSVKILKEE